ncbi:MAG: multidrug efflux SMR transporter [Deltaproteobacteria bacterium]|nr:multidrug efflux SMR transporter [Deltaproteobacteria bacterium]
MSWFYLFLAIGLEISGTTCMKLSQGFTRPVPSFLLFFFYTLSVVFLTLAVKRLDISIAYAVWSGLGTALMACIGIAWFGEPLTTARAVALGLIILGVVGVNLAD